MNYEPRTAKAIYPVKIGEHELVKASFADELERENNELRELVDLITKQEMSDSGRIFYPNKITSCRCLDQKRMGEITEKYRSTPHIERD